jgi:3-phenylpropionate/cinnamic acid dioxygenase small subunit
MADAVSILTDRFDVISLQNRYTYALDSKDFDTVKECFLPDAEISYSSLGTVTDFPTFFESHRRNIMALESTQHLIGNIDVKIDGDTAICISYVQAMHYADDGDRWVTGGRYDDELVRTADGWRISKRDFTRQWVEDHNGLAKRFLEKWGR